jgi:hypothetical protein
MERQGITLGISLWAALCERVVRQQLPHLFVYSIIFAFAHLAMVRIFLEFTVSLIIPAAAL